MVRLVKKGKLKPRYIGPFEILARIDPVAYKMKLPQELQIVHDTFHVSNLERWLSVETLVIPLEEIQVNEKLNFVEEPVSGNQEVETKSNPYRESKMECQAQTRVYQGARGSNETEIPSSLR